MCAIKSVRRVTTLDVRFAVSEDRKPHRKNCQRGTPVHVTAASYTTASAGDQSYDEATMAGPKNPVSPNPSQSSDRK